MLNQQVREPKTIAERIAVGIGYMTLGEVDLIHRLAPSVPKDAVCVNIGCGAGTSIIALLEYRPDLYMHSVDIDENNGMSQLHQAGVMSHIYKIIGDSKQVGWNGAPINWWFCDGDHSEEGIRGDIEAWLSKLGYDAYLLFHDYGSPNWPSVKQVVDEYAVKYGWELIGHVDTLIVYKLP